MEAILEVKNLSKGFKTFSLDNVSFTLPKGYIMGFIGPNGAGKSTTIKLIMNLLKKERGEVRIFGMEHQKREVEIKNRIGFVYDENVFYEELTVGEMRWIIAPLYQGWDEKEFQRYMKEFNLPQKKKMKELSKGMKMKFSIAMALSHHAELLIMDEPTSGLDPLVRHEILDILSEFIQDEKKSVLFSTHITSDLDKISDYITFIHDGKIVLSEGKDEVLDQYGIVKGGIELLDADIRKEFIGLRENRYGFEGLIADRNQARAQFADQVVIEKPTLEDLMIYYTRGQKVHG